MILYKYYGYESGITALQSSRLGFRCPNFFNDPFELSLPVRSDNPTEARLSEAFWTIRTYVAILSLTREPLDPLMWAHYGGEHAGFVVGYDTRGDFLSSSEFNIVPIDQGGVRYAQLATAELIDAVDEDAARALIHWSLGARDDTPDEVRDACRNLFLTKHPRWAYENEVRAVKRPHSLLEEEHIYQSHPLRRIALSPSRVVAPMIQVPSVAGLSIFDHQVPIVEVYLGARNPLCTAKQNPSAFVDRSLVEKALAEKWTIYRTEVDSSSWNLRAVKLGVESLGVVSRVNGLIHYSKLPGRVARMVRDTLAGVDIDDNDVFEASNWNGECHLQKNGMFVGKNGKLID